MIVHAKHRQTAETPVEGAYALPFARPADGNRPAQPLRAHLLNVANLAAVFAKPFGLAAEAKHAGILHDLGKYRRAFQDYLAGNHVKDAKTWHAADGAKIAARENAIMQAFAVAGHHAGLHDLADIQERIRNDQPIVLSDLVRLFEQDIGAITAYSVANKNIQNTLENKLIGECAIRMLFSALVDADRLDAAFWPERPPEAHGLDADVLLNKIKQAVVDRQRLGNAMQDSRNFVFNTCLDAGAQSQGFFSLNVPTGGGKTLASMAFALAHARRHGLRRVIVVIPYLSIIEQNAAEYSRIFGVDSVLECHSAVEKTDAYEQPMCDLWSENWDAPLIITTSVQFLESLFAASPSRCRKLHRLARSVVIFDEVQTMPPHLMRPVLSVMRELVSRYQTSFLFCSATTPAFKKTSNLPEGFSPNELKSVLSAADETAMFRKLRRVKYHFPLSDVRMNWPELAVKLMEQSQVLCVVNTTRHARELWLEMQKQDLLKSTHKPFHLSAGMCAQHRFDKLNDIRVLLRHGAPCRVISTQLVEAGVDIDFPCVWRAFGPLDSIVQAAGRCNREGRQKIGNVHVFHPADESIPRGIYSTATGQAAVELARFTYEPDSGAALATDPELFGRYFNALYGMMEVGTDIQEMRASLKFRSVAEATKVIKDSGQPVVVPYGMGPRLIDDLHERLLRHAPPQEVRAGFRALQRYMVNLRRYNYERFLSIGAIKTPWDGAPVLVLQDGFYNNDLGLVVENHPPEDLIV